MAIYDIHKNGTRVVTVIPTLDGVPTDKAENCEFSTASTNALSLGVDPDAPENTFKVAVKLLTSEAATVDYKFDGRKGDGVVPVKGSFEINPLAEDANGSTTEAGPEF